MHHVNEHCQVVGDHSTGTFVINAFATSCNDLATQLARALTHVGVPWTALGAIRVFAQAEDSLNWIPAGMLMVFIGCYGRKENASINPLIMLLYSSW